MSKYEQELSELKPHDPAQFTENYKGYDFIVTAGHGYLIVPKSHQRANEGSGSADKKNFQTTLFHLSLPWDVISRSKKSFFKKSLFAN